MLPNTRHVRSKLPSKPLEERKGSSMTNQRDIPKCSIGIGHHFAAACVVTLLFSSAPSVANAQFDPVTHPTTGHSYLVVDGGGTVEWHRARAALLGGTLAALTDAAERDFVAAQFGGGAVTLIGLSDEDVPGVFVWETGEPLIDTAWGPNHPSTQFSPRFARGFTTWTTSDGTATTALVEVAGTIDPFAPFVTCGSVTGGAELTWDAPGYDEVRVLIDGVDTFTFVGASGSMTFPLGLGTHVFEVVAVRPTSVSALARCSSFISADDATYSLPILDLLDANSAAVALTLDTTIGPMGGMSGGICLDTAQVAVENLAIGAGITSVFPTPDFVDLSDAFTNGIGFGFVFDILGVQTLPPGLGIEVLRFDVTPLVEGAVSELRPCNEVGAAAISSVVVVGGQSFPASLIPGAVRFRTTMFRRGDCNVDGMIDIADALFLLVHLFDPTVNDYPCLEACEVNGDASVDIADPVTLLTYLFAAGAPPGAPFPDCGPDPEPETAFECVLATECP